MAPPRAPIAKQLTSTGSLQEASASASPANASCSRRTAPGTSAGGAGHTSGSRCPSSSSRCCCCVPSCRSRRPNPQRLTSSSGAESLASPTSAPLQLAAPSLGADRRAINRFTSARLDSEALRTMRCCCAASRTASPCHAGGGRTASSGSSSCCCAACQNISGCRSQRPCWPSGSPACRHRRIACCSCLSCACRGGKEGVMLLYSTATSSWNGSTTAQPPAAAAASGGAVALVASARLSDRAACRSAVSSVQPSGAWYVCTASLRPPACSTAATSSRDAASHGRRCCCPCTSGSGVGASNARLPLSAVNTTVSEAASGCGSSSCRPSPAAAAAASPQARGFTCSRRRMSAGEAHSAGDPGGSSQHTSHSAAAQGSSASSRSILLLAPLPPAALGVPAGEPPPMLSNITARSGSGM